MKVFLRWFFGNHKIAATEAPPKFTIRIGKYWFGFKAPWRLYWPSGPSIQAYKYHEFLHHKLHRFKCRVCGVGVWGWGQHLHCGKWTCYKKLEERCKRNG